MEHPAYNIWNFVQNASFKGIDTFTLFDHFYIDMINKAEEAYQNLNGGFCIEDVGADTDGYIDFDMKIAY